jgi:hypothetical protein
MIKMISELPLYWNLQKNYFKLGGAVNFLKKAKGQT